ncbi:hypothetical protein Btru_002497 [Bulinus truncatus]|nr:hypothetical protein Btru_002497 [Bulinus truncatus]
MSVPIASVIYMAGAQPFSFGTVRDDYSEQNMQSDCDNDIYHWKYIKHQDFVDMNPTYTHMISERVNLTEEHGANREILQDNIRTNLHTFLGKMSDLTCLLILKSNKRVKYCGAGFVLKIKMKTDSQCPCPRQHEHVQTDHAIVTVSTAYHVFNTMEGRQVTYEKAYEIWGKYKQEVYLDYNGPDRQLQDFLNCEDLPTLYGHRLIETDKDLDLDSDWCAAEFVTHHPSVIDRLVGTVSEYQSELAKLYKMSLDYGDLGLVVIIGHSHCWAKRISVGRTWEFETGKHKEVLKEIRDHQTWCRYYYDALTCPGSSGSPIFKWGQPISGFGYWFGHPHNHCEGDSDEDGTPLGRSTIGVEHKVQ